MTSLFDLTKKGPSTSKVMEEFRDEDQSTKLWDRFATNKLHILVVCLFEFMRFAKLTIVEVIGNIQNKKTIFMQLSL
jgi:hypothetical protein